MNIYAVPDLVAFLQAALLLPRSLTADFNFPQWHSPQRRIGVQCSRSGEGAGGYQL
jgi:hypothetical protein